jgi:hypothetical protein
MNRSYPLVDIHYALWAVLAVPIGFAGMFFLVPGLILSWGFGLLALSGLLVTYVWKQVHGSRAAWLLGTLAHLALLIAAAYYVPRWPTLLGAPFALANLYSLIVLLAYRKVWTTPADPALEALIA